MTIESMRIDWLTATYLQEAIEIEKVSFANPMTEEEIRVMMRIRNVCGFAAHVKGTVLGYGIYQLFNNSIKLLRLAVQPEFRREGVGREMIGRLVFKLTPERRRSLHTTVRESNLAAQLFLRDAGFKALKVRRDCFADEDGYLMIRTLEGYAHEYPGANAEAGSAH